MQQQLETDLYDVLGVSKDASDKDIKRAYKKLAQKFHPDVNHDDPGAAERFKEISAANDVLGDPDKRAEYDEFRSMVGSGFSPGAGANFGGGHPGSAFSGDDLNSLFGQMFGARQPMAQMMRIEIGFGDAVRGTDVSIGDSTVHLPAGIETGEQLLVHRPDGDLIIEVVVGTHPQFGRDGLHLTLDVPVSVTEAILGGKVKVPAFDGKPVTLKIPAGTPHGRTFRVKGRGIDADGRRGDMLVSVRLEIPKDLTDDQNEALRQYAAAAPKITHPNRI